MDYIFRWLELKFAPEAARADARTTRWRGTDVIYARHRRGDRPSVPGLGAQLAYQEGCWCVIRADITGAGETNLCHHGEFALLIRE